MSDSTAAITDPPADPPPTDPLPTDPPPADPPPTDPPTSTGWRDGIEDKEAREFAGRFTSPADLAKAGLDFRKKLSNSINLPPKDATEDQIKEYRDRLGVPAEASGYEISLPEELPDELKPADDDPILSEFLATMHKAGATPDVVKDTTNWFYGHVMATRDRSAKKLLEAREESSAALRREWGSDYEANLNSAKHAVAEFGDDAFKAFVNTKTIDGVPLGNHPVFTRIFATIGRRMGEDSLHVGMTDDQRSDVRKQITDVRAQRREAMDKNDRRLAVELDQKERDLWDVLEGANKPVVGEAGRTL